MKVKIFNICITQWHFHRVFYPPNFSINPNLVTMDDKGMTMVTVLNIIGEYLAINEGTTITHGEPIIFNKKNATREMNTDPIIPKKR